MISGAERKAAQARGARGKGIGSFHGVTKICARCQQSFPVGGYNAEEWPKAVQRKCISCVAQLAAGGEAVIIPQGAHGVPVVRRGTGRSNDKAAAGHMTSQHRGVHWYSWRRKWRAEIQGEFYFSLRHMTELSSILMLLLMIIMLVVFYCFMISYE